MPPRYLRKGTTKLKPCSEFIVEACDLAPADQCCGALPCALCLELETYADGILYGTATFGGSSWTGTVGGLAFVSYWERDYLTDDCEYVVTLDGEEVYRATCYEGASCRDPGGSVGVTIGYDEGTLTWAKHEPRPLAVVVDPDTGCNDFFCGTCRCSCRTLCATLIIPNVTTLRGKLFDVTYSDCESPVWSGTVGDYDLTVTLGKDQYDGSCIASLAANDEDGGWVEVTGCEDLTATWTLYDGTTVSITCQACSNCEPICEPCPEPTVYPTLIVNVYPLSNCAVSARNVTVTYNSSIGSWNGSGPWSGTGDQINIRLSCVGNSFMASVNVTLSGSPTGCTFGATSPTNQDCALLLYDWVMNGELGGVFCCGGGLLGSNIGLTVIL